MFLAKAAAELAVADGLLPGSEAVASVGDPFATVMLVKGLPGPAEASRGDALSGPDGEAARKALEALGFDPDAVFATLSRPASGCADSAVARRLRMQVEAVDPPVIIALDPTAAADCAAALGFEQPDAGVLIEHGGRRIVALAGLEASLADPHLKSRVWKQLQGLKPPEAVW